MTLVYVGGAMGDTPVIATTDLALALQRTMACYVSHGPDDSYEEQWTCAFIDGEPDATMLRWTCEVKGDKLYVEVFDLEKP